MKIVLLSLLVLTFYGCKQSNNIPIQKPEKVEVKKTYAQIKTGINKNRLSFRASPDYTLISDYWITSIRDDLYNLWKGTPWDYNGTTSTPGKGYVACGYFVTAILQDMGCKINRIKLSTCASSQMMNSLVPQQKIKNLSYLSYVDFNKAIQASGKGVYIIGLDFHTGIIINDGNENWFLHSYYVKQQGVIKEKVLESNALKSSKTKWIITLTGDKQFLNRWMNG